MKKFLQTLEIAKQISIITLLICFIFVGNLFAETNGEATSNKSFVEVKDNGVLAWSFDKQNNSKPEGKPTKKIANKLIKEYNDVMIPLESYPCEGEPQKATVMPTNTVYAGVSQTTALYLSGLTEDDLSFQWKVSDSPGGPYADIANAISETYTAPGLGSNGTAKYYVCEVTCDNTGDKTLSREASIKRIAAYCSVSGSSHACAIGNNFAIAKVEVGSTVLINQGCGSKLSKFY